MCTLSCTYMNIKTTLHISTDRKKIFEIAQEVQKPCVYYTFTEKGRPKAVLMSAEEFESWQETLEIMSDPHLMKDIEEAEEEYKRGEYITWEDLKKELGFLPHGAMAVADKSKKKYSAKRRAK